jgi:hypothetical protein
MPDTTPGVQMSSYGGGLKSLGWGVGETLCVGVGVGETPHLAIFAESLTVCWLCKLREGEP